MKECVAEASSTIQGEPVLMRFSESSPMCVVEAPKSVSIEEIFAIKKFELPVITKKAREGKELSREIANVVKGSIAGIRNQKAKIPFQVELLD